MKELYFVEYASNPNAYYAGSDEWYIQETEILAENLEEAKNHARCRYSAVIKVQLKADYEREIEEGRKRAEERARKREEKEKREAEKREAREKYWAEYRAKQEAAKTDEKAAAELKEMDRQAKAKKYEKELADIKKKMEKMKHREAYLEKWLAKHN